jgi:hypothetical protein
MATLTKKERSQMETSILSTMEGGIRSEVKKSSKKVYCISIILAAIVSIAVASFSNWGPVVKDGAVTIKDKIADIVTSDEVVDIDTEVVEEAILKE